jgi:hypothetical protein
MASPELHVACATLGSFRHFVTKAGLSHSQRCLPKPVLHRTEPSALRGPENAVGLECLRVCG